MGGDEKNLSLSHQIMREHDQESRSSGSVASGNGDGKLLIKPKIPKEDVEEGEIWPQSTKPQTRVCHLCNKMFGCGKALGGHMRVHQVQLQATTKDYPKKQQLQLQDDDASESKNCNGNGNGSSSVTESSGGGSGNNAKQVPTCLICTKTFPSMKSLFGHMRCHPERGWRGIQPPPPPLPPPPSHLKDDDATEMDLTKSLAGWKVTDRRGRKALKPYSTSSSSYADEDDEEQLRDAVQDLMSLAQANSSKSSPTVLLNVDVEATFSNSPTNKPGIEGDNNGASDYSYAQKAKFERKASRMDASVDKGKEDAWISCADLHKYQDVEVDDNDDDDDDDEGSKKCADDESESASTRPVMVSRRKKKKLKLSDLESLRDATSIADHHKIQIHIQRPAIARYKCSTCNKRFLTHQALGGHRSSHNKIRNFHNGIEGSSYAVTADNECYANQAHEVRERAAITQQLMAESTHQCEICSKTFRTGQALGGHKRCHWTCPVDQPPSSQGEASQTGPRILGFDLNAPPPIEDEEGVESQHAVGYGYGHGHGHAFSYNSIAASRN